MFARIRAVKRGSLRSKRIEQNSAVHGVRLTFELQKAGAKMSSKENPMAINKTAAGTFRVDFRDQKGRRLRKTFDTLKAAREYDRISKGDVSKVISLHLQRRLWRRWLGCGTARKRNPVAIGRRLSRTGKPILKNTSSQSSAPTRFSRLMRLKLRRLPQSGRTERAPTPRTRFSPPSVPSSS